MRYSLKAICVFAITAAVMTGISRTRILRAEEADAKTISLGDGVISLEAPAGWIREQPRVRIIEAEFSVPAVEGDANAAGRVTLMRAGGTVQANIDRWMAQFSPLDRKAVEKTSVAGQEVHLVDLAGTYLNRRGPFAPAVASDDYRMLGAIVVTKQYGRYFVKFYGPRAIVGKNEKAFQSMIKSLKVK
jgi:hypothetical protein